MWQVGKLGVMMVNHERVLLLLFLFVGLLGACAEGAEVAGNTAVPTPVPTIEPPATETAVPPDTPTENRFSEGLVLGEDAETNRVVTTSEPEPPVLNATPTPLFLALSASGGTLPEVDRSQDAFVLKSPDPALLLELLVTLSNKAKQQGPGMFQFQELLMTDIDIYYDNELPTAYFLLGNDKLYLAEQVAEPLQSNWEVIRAAVIQYLNNSTLRESPELSLGTQKLDLDTDGQEDLLVEFSAFGHSISGLIPLKILADGSYQLIPNDFPPESTNILYENTVYLDHDVTGDGQPEVIWYTRSYWGRGYFEEIRVFYWDGQKLSLLEQIDLSRSAEDFIPQFSIDDFNNDTITDIQITTEMSGNFECEMQVSQIYSWPNAQPVTETQVQVSTPACYVSRSIEFNENPEQTAASLQAALSDWEPTDTTNAGLIALARIHLAVAQAELGLVSDAQATLDGLYSLPSDAEFVQLAKNAYETAGKRPLQTCRNLLASANELLTTEIGYYLTWDAANPYFVTWGDMDGALPHYGTICNLFRTAEYLVKNNTFASEISPLSFLSSRDIRYEFAIQVNLDDDPEQEWIGILEPDWPLLLRYDQIEGIWQSRIEWLYLDEVSDFAVLSKDVTGDGLNDIIGLVTGRDHCFDQNMQMNAQIVQILYTEDTSARFFGDSFSCLETPLLEQDDISEEIFTRQELSSSQNAFWRSLTDFPATELSIVEYSQELQKAVLNQNDPTIPEKITQLLNYLPADDPEAQPTIEHLTYLLGYFYELGGEDESAVSTYLDLIQRYPTSPWSWLAWARLEPVE
jgi:hypothetical protein